MVMGNESEELRFFYAVLDRLIQETGWGGQVALSIGAHLSEGYLSQVINRKRRPSFDAQVKIANALGYQYIDFLLLGEKLLRSENPLTPADFAVMVREIKEFHSLGQRADISLRDVAAEHFMSGWPPEIREACRTVKKILEAGEPTTAEALKMNIAAFAKLIDSQARNETLLADVDRLKRDIEEIKRINKINRFTGTD